MMRYVYLLSICCLAQWVYGQTSPIDSLQRLVGREVSTIRKIELLNQLSFRFMDIDIERSGILSFEALQLSRKIGDKKGEGWALAYRGIYHLFNGDLGNAQNRLRQSIAIGRDVEDSRLEAYALGQLGNVFRDKGVFDSAYYFYRRSEAIAVDNHDQYYQSVVKMNLGRYYLILSKPDSALHAVQEALRIRETLHDQESLPDVWILLGSCYQSQFNYDEAQRYLDKAYDVAAKVPAMRNEYLVNKGEIFFNQGNFLRALENWEGVLAYQPSYKYKVASLLCRMGEVFEEQGYYELAIDYLSRSLRISEKAPFKYLMGEAYYEIGWVFYRINNLPLASQSIKESQRIFREMNQELKLAGTYNVIGLIQMKKLNYDSSLYYHLVSLRERERLENKVAISSSVFNLGQLYIERGEYQKALNYFWRSAGIDERIHDAYGMSLNYYQLGKTHNLLHAYDSSRFYLNKAIAMASANSANEVLRNSYREMANYLQGTGRPDEAITYYEKYIQVSDSVFSKQSSQNLAAYHSLYEVEKKEREIEILNKDNLLVRARVERQNTLVYMTLGVLVVLIMVALFYYRFALRLRKLNTGITEKSEQIQIQSAKIAEANKGLSKLNLELKESNDQLRNALDDLRRMQEQLIQSEKMASLGLLSSGVAHELNNPLNFIKGGVNVLGMQLQDLEESKQKEIKAYIDIINEGVDRSAAIIKGLSHYSRQSEQQNERCDIPRILDNCLLILGTRLKHRITVEKDYGKQPFTLLGNEGKLHQAFINILSNAEQAIEGPGTIRIELEERQGVKCISIADTGCGILEENLGRLGDPFYTTKAPGEGTGLGLSITYKIIRDYGGTIAVESKPNEGTTFTFSFPQ